MLNKKSLDDLAMLETRSARSRSSSPSKNRNSLPAHLFDMRLPNLPMASHEDLMSATSSSSSSSVSHEHLKKLSNSPLSNRLRVTTGDKGKYVIPIPFTLQLPPKLSQKNIVQELERAQEKARSRSSSPRNSPTRTLSPARSRSPLKNRTKLVYNGSTYEKLESSSDDEYSEEMINQRIQFRPNKVTNKVTNRASKVSFQNSMAADELSIIEEASNSEASSRQSSVKDTKNDPKHKDSEKLLPPAPTTRERPVPVLKERTLSEKQQNNTSVFPANKPNLPQEKDLPRNVPALQQTPPAPISALPQNQKRSATPAGKLGPRLPQYSIPNTVKPNTVSHPVTSRGLSQKPVLTNVRFVKPNEATKQIKECKVQDIKVPEKKLNMKVDHPSDLKIPKRSFSDESYVSSISDFSSVADVMSINRLPVSARNIETSPMVVRRFGINTMPANTLKPQRNVSSSSTESKDSAGSGASWDSLQSSVQLSFKQAEEPTRTHLTVNKPKYDKSLPPSPKPTKNNIGKVDDWEDCEEVSESGLDNTSFEYSQIHSKIDHISSVSISQDTEETDEGEETEEMSEDFEDFEDFERREKSKTTKPKSPIDVEPSSKVCSEVSGPGLAAPHILRKDPKSADDIYDYYFDDMASISTAKYSEITCSTVSPFNKQVTPDAENNGAGKRFSFPNNNRNVTNSERFQKQHLSESHQLSRSRSSFLSKDGQIEIPDLETESYSTLSYTGKAYDFASESSHATEGVEDSPLEPIGYPSKAAQNVVKEHFKSLYDDDSDTDIESTKFSMYASKQSKSSPNLLMTTKDKKLPPKPSGSRLPVRHQRHKSMYNIDFDANEFKSHKRSNTTDLSNLTTPKLGAPGTNDEVTTPVDSPEPLNIVVSEPPSQVRYEVDFKEAKGSDNYAPFVHKMPSMHDIYRKISVKPTIEGVENQVRHMSLRERRNSVSTKSSAKSSFISGNSERRSVTTSPTETESIVIDLTKENYDICLVNRTNTTHSYKSVTEKTRDGKDVEVVLVDEDDDDELMSLYSKYRNDSWLFRTGSTTSSKASSTSTDSYDSIRPETTLRVKPSMPRYNTTNSLRAPDINRERSNVSNTSSKYYKNRVQPPFDESKVLMKPTARPAYSQSNKRHTIPMMDSNYFDYTSGDNYDFNSFMQQQVSPKPTF